MNTEKPRKNRKKKTALVICSEGKEFWTTQGQFWQWCREGVIEKTGDQPLTGLFNREYQELLVLMSNRVLDLGNRNSIQETVLSRKVGVSGR